MIGDDDTRPADEPAISRAPTPQMPAEDLRALLEIERLVAEQRRRLVIQGRRPPRGRR